MHQTDWYSSLMANECYWSLHAVFCKQTWYFIQPWGYMNGNCSSHTWYSCKAAVNEGWWLAEQVQVRNEVKCSMSSFHPWMLPGINSPHLLHARRLTLSTSVIEGIRLPVTKVITTSGAWRMPTIHCCINHITATHPSITSKWPQLKPCRAIIIYFEKPLRNDVKWVEFKSDWHEDHWPGVSMVDTSKNYAYLECNLHCILPDNCVMAWFSVMATAAR